MYVCAAYKRTERKTRVADIKLRFVTDPKLDSAVTVFLIAVSARPYRYVLMRLWRFHAIVFQ
jgi:hypothetical protein